MAKIKMDVKGGDKLNKKLGKMIKMLENPFVPMTKAVSHLQNKLADYPGQGANITGYVRTGTLGRRWTTVVSHGGKRGKVGNNTWYGPYVQSGERQAWMHVGRWQTDASVAEDETPTVYNIFEEALLKEMG